MLVGTVTCLQVQIESYESMVVIIKPDFQNSGCSVSAVSELSDGVEVPVFAAVL